MALAASNGARTPVRSGHTVMTEDVGAGPTGSSRSAGRNRNTLVVEGGAETEIAGREVKVARAGEDTTAVNGVTVAGVAVILSYVR